MVDAGKFVTHVLDLTFIETAKKGKINFNMFEKNFAFNIPSLFNHLPPTSQTYSTFLL